MEYGNSHGSNINVYLSSVAKLFTKNICTENRVLNFYFYFISFNWMPLFQRLGNKNEIGLGVSRGHSMDIWI